MNYKTVFRSGSKLSPRGVIDGKAISIKASIRREVTDAQLDAAKKAHVIGFSQKGRNGTVARAGNWTDKHIKQKRKILRKASRRWCYINIL